MDRRLILAGGIAFWSLATALAGFAQDLTQLILFRSLVGVGEAAFATIASPMIADFYPGSQRNRAYTIFGLSALESCRNGGVEADGRSSSSKRRCLGLEVGQWGLP